MKNLFFSFVFTGLLISLALNVNAQGVGINSSGNPPDPSAILDASSTTKGTLITRMTTAQRNAIVSPAEGLQIFNTTTRCLEIYANAVWQSTFCSCITPSVPTAGTNTSTQTQIVWNWNAATGATGYKYSTINNYSTATDNGSNTSYTQTGLTCGTNYTLYLWSYSIACPSALTTLTQTTSACCTAGTGGSITTIGNTTIHTFTSSGAFTINCAVNAQVLVVAGGGGGGGVIGGGGGAGGVLYQSSFSIPANSYTVTVGDGGLGGFGYQTPHLPNQIGLQGGNSIFSTLTAIGGGGGAGWRDVEASNFATSGGSGGGGGGNLSGTGAPGTVGQGNAGGNGNNDGNHGAGGGGAGFPGQNYPPGTGGDGFLSSISGSPAYYGGGGGTRSGSGSGQAGGLGGGGAGNNSSVKAGNGMPNTGGGGGGAGYTGDNSSNRIGGDGGSGIVIISYPTP